MSPGAPLTVGRYELFRTLVAGETAQISLARMVGDDGFSKIVAVKELLPDRREDARLGSALLAEGRFAALVRHPNVLQVLDVVATSTGPIVVMDHVVGATLGALLAATARRKQRVPTPVLAALAIGILEGLQAAHDVASDGREPREAVHGDVSPDNILVGVDGLARLTAFGLATEPAGPVHPSDDVRAASLVIWEMATGQRRSGTEASAPAAAAPDAPALATDAHVPAELAAVILRGLARERADRYPTAREMALAIEAVASPAPARDVAAWVRRHARARIAEQEADLRELASRPRPSPGAPASTSPETRRPIALEASDVPPDTTAPRDRRRLLAFALCTTALLLTIVGLSVAARRPGSALAFPPAPGSVEREASSTPRVDATAAPVPASTPTAAAAATLRERPASKTPRKGPSRPPPPSARDADALRLDSRK